MHNVHGNDWINHLIEKNPSILLFYLILTFFRVIQNEHEAATEEEQIKDIYIMYIERDLFSKS